MTREEAIEQLQNCKGLIKQDGKDWLDERDIPLLDMAISALKDRDGMIRAILDVLDSDDFPEDICHKIELMLRGEEE